MRTVSTLLLNNVWCGVGAGFAGVIGVTGPVTGLVTGLVTGPAFVMTFKSTGQDRYLGKVRWGEDIKKVTNRVM